MNTGTKIAGVECPECGSIFTAGRHGGYSPSGLRIRRRVCKTCDHSFATVEVAADFVFNRVDTQSEGRVRSKKRKYSTPLRRARISKDDLEVTVKVIPGKENPWCNKLLHRMEGQNVLTTTRGHRRCRECVREARRERSRIERMVNGDEVRRRQREWYHRQGDALRQKRSQQAAMRRLARKVIDDIHTTV